MKNYAVVIDAVYRKESRNNFEYNNFCHSKLKPSFCPNSHTYFCACVISINDLIPPIFLAAENLRNGGCWWFNPLFIGEGIRSLTFWKGLMFLAALTCSDGSRVSGNREGLKKNLEIGLFRASLLIPAVRAICRCLRLGSHSEWQVSWEPVEQAFKIYIMWYKHLSFQMEKKL